MDSRLRLAGLDEEAALTAAARLHELFGKELRGGGAQKPKKGGRKLRKEEGEGAVGAYGRARSWKAKLILHARHQGALSSRRCVRAPTAGTRA